MPMFATLTGRLRAQPSWRKLDEAIARMRPHCTTEIEQDEERCLEAMHHWHSPVERSRALHCRRRALVDDNPASG
jgi:hypothetical protein